VASGRIIAGPHVRAACARHLRDLKRQGTPAFPYVWTAAPKPKDVGKFQDLSARAIAFFPTVLRLNGGDFEGLPFHLLPWQQFIVGSLFGWVDYAGNRRFRVAYVETGKGSGKSPLAAGVGLLGMMADGEARAEVYAAATKRDQAMILFRDAVAMVNLSPALSKRITKSGNNPTWNLADLRTGSFFRPISSDDGQSGPRPHVGLIDEYHEHKTATVMEMMRAGTKGRRQALIFIITNSGFDRASPCFERHTYGAKVAAGDVQDESLFAYICAIDEGDDPIHDEPDSELGYPRSWAKPNPSLGITFQPIYLEEQVREARGMPSKESIVRRLNFCEWVDAENPWIDGDLWRACEVDPEEWEEPEGESFLALDLSGKRDLTAASRVTLAGESVAAELRFWTPGDTLLERATKDKVPYDAWVRDGHLTAVPGRSIDYAQVVHDLADWLTAPNVRALAFDPYRMQDFQRELDNAGIDSYVAKWDEKLEQWVDEATGQPGDGLRLMRHGQGFGGGASDSALWMPRSITHLEDAVLGGRLRVKKNPVLTWASASAVIEQDAQANKKWEKRKSTGRIDGIVSLCMGAGLALATPPAEPSVYDEEGITFL
jgi:phage terminase large subunit-like protein